MRAAGYDPSAFGTLFQKLHAAEAKRSERLQTLKKSLAARMHVAGSKVGANAATSQVTSLVAGVKGTVTDNASEKIIEQLSVFNREYDSPDERQAALAAYARAHRQLKRRPAPEMQWKDVVQSGPGATLLVLDADAISTLDALAANSAAAASQGIVRLGNGDSAQPSAHLNLAVGTYYEVKGKRDIGERSANAWLGARHTPAQAYNWSASYKSARGDYAGAIETLEAGRKRVGASAPFLPNLVSVALAAGNRALAERYTQECAAEDRGSVGGALQTMVHAKPAPTGLHAECLRRLGSTPGPTPEGAIAQTLQSPLKAPGALGGKLKGLLNRK
jgi:hypothetical protein